MHGISDPQKQVTHLLSVPAWTPAIIQVAPAQGPSREAPVLFGDFLEPVLLC